MKNKKGCLLNLFLITGLFALALVVTYRYVFYARYLYFNDNDKKVEFNWHESEHFVRVKTDANSWTIEKNEPADWITYYRDGDFLHIFTSQNDSITDRKCYVSIRSGYERGANFASWAGFGKSDQLKIVQKGKQATYLKSSKQTVSFSVRGGTDSLQIRTDGEIWEVVGCPNWITKIASGETLVLRASKNTGKAPRNGMVNLKSDNLSSTITVSQESNYVLSITSVKMGNVYSNGRIETNYGGNIYSNRAMFLSPLIEYTGYKTGNYTLYCKLYNPRGQLVFNNTYSPSGYSYKTNINIYIGNQTAVLSRWGYERPGYWQAGQYRYEIWHNGQCLATKYFTIY